MDSAPISFEEKWVRLIDAFMQGTVVPFIGAGMSYGAKMSGASSQDKLINMEDTKDLVEKYWNYLLKKYPKSPPLLLLKADFEQRQQIDPKARLELAAVAALYFDLEPNGETCFYEEGQPFDAKLFARICPNPGHVFLARLAREGLIREAITTNYDTAVESAYWESFGVRRPVLKERIFKPANDPVFPISDHLEYRAHALHRVATLPDLGNVPVLHLYKINGCAEGWSRRRKDKKPTDGYLIITERHLMDFGARKWASDLLRDRIRCRQIIFIGFGAEEPQVRFTALQVVEEFSSAPVRDPDQPKTAHADFQAQIFAHCYGPQPERSINQIMRASLGPYEFAKDPHQASFFGAEASWFIEKAEKNLLPSDDFCERVWLSCIARILKRDLPNSVAMLRLRDRAFPVALIQRDLLARLFDPEGGISKNTFGERSDFRFLFVSTLGQDGKRTGNFRLMDYVRGVLNKDADNTKGYYDPISAPGSVGISVLLILHFIALYEERTDIRSHCEDSTASPASAGGVLWFRIRRKNLPAAWVAVSDQNRRPDALPPWGHPPGHFIQLLLREPLTGLENLAGEQLHLPLGSGKGDVYFSLTRIVKTVSETLRIARKTWHPSEPYATPLIEALLNATHPVQPRPRSLWSPDNPIFKTLS